MKTLKKYLRAAMMSFTMFCAIPCPFHTWDDEARPLMTLFLPAVGAWIGLLWAALLWGERWLMTAAFAAVPGAAYVLAAALCAYPFLITGFMHADGFLDVVDAVRSWRNLDERRRIVKDPHSGSFAVIACSLLMTGMYAASYAALTGDAPVWKLCFLAVTSRTASALAVTVLRPMSISEYSGNYRKNIAAPHAYILAVILAAAVIAPVFIWGFSGLFCAAAAAFHALAVRRGYKSLDGMSGDISGYALTWAELAGLCAMALL